jgi:hypothetical protein
LSNEPHSLAYQIACLNEAIGLCERETVREGLKAARNTIQAVRDQRHFLRMMSELKARDPELFQALYTISANFPGTTIHEAERVGL